jgi:hypothetical protein
MSIHDLDYLDDNTLPGKLQIRIILHDGYGVPQEIVDWIFERLDARAHQYQDRIIAIMEDRAEERDFASQ